MSVECGDVRLDRRFGHCNQQCVGAKDLLLHVSSAVAQAGDVDPLWLDGLCWRHPEECRFRRCRINARNWTRVWTRMKEVNRTANESIGACEQSEHWGTMADHWDFIQWMGKGLQKIYALYKRKLLLDAGLPRQALLMTIVEIPTGERHAILTRSNRPRRLLSSTTSRMRCEPGTDRYQFIKRQSQTT